MTSTPHHLSPTELAGIDWRISSYSTNGGGSDCVEAGLLRDGTGRVAVRHSRHPDAGTIVYTRAEWDAFLKGVHDGEFDF